MDINVYAIFGLIYISFFLANILFLKNCDGYRCILFLHKLLCVNRIAQNRIE